MIGKSSIMNVSPLLLLICLFTLMTGLACNCPPDEEIGQLGLSEASRHFLPYDGTETLRFVNDSGQAMAFSAPRGEEAGQDQLCVNIICTEARFNSPSSCEYYLTDNLRYIFVSDDKERLLDLAVFTGLYEWETEHFFDALQASYSSGTPSIQAGQVIEQRFDGTFVPEETNITNLMQKRESVELNGTVFTDVWSFEQDNLGFYLQPGKGVIALKENSQVWVLEE
jgi:hypothetical protein